MRILFCTNSLGAHGGLERVTIVKANAFAGIPGNEVAVCFTDKGTYPDDTIHPISDKVRVIDLGVTFWDLYPLNLKNLAVTAPLKFHRLRKAIKKTILDFRPDVVITTGSYEKYALATISPRKLLAKPTVKIREYHFNSNYRRYTGGSKFFKVVEWFEYKILGQLFDMNYLLTKEDKETNFPGNSKFDYQHNPFFNTETQVDNINKENTVIAVNRLVDQKNPLALIRIWSKIADKMPEWKLVIVGDGPKKEEMIQSAYNYGIKDRIIFMGHRKDVFTLLQNSKILAMTSRYEGFGLSIIEAMSQGVVPISYRTPYGPADIITDGKDGVLVDYMDEAQFSEKLLELMQSPEQIERMSAAAKERSKDFEVNKIAEEWMDKYYTLITRH